MYSLVCRSYKDEMVEDAPILYGNVPQVARPFSVAAPRCYCLLSKFPYFGVRLEYISFANELTSSSQVHFTTLYTLLGKDQLIRINREMSEDRDECLAGANGANYSPMLSSASLAYSLLAFAEVKNVLAYYRGLQVLHSCAPKLSLACFGLGVDLLLTVPSLGSNQLQAYRSAAR
jgi:hypothetical protein